MAHLQDCLIQAAHLTAEAKTEEFVAGKGVVVRWERLGKQNHWRDALYNACVAGHACGVTLVDEKTPSPEPPRTTWWADPQYTGEHRPSWINDDGKIELPWRERRW